MLLFNYCRFLLIMVTLGIIVNRCLSVNNQNQNQEEEKSSNIVEKMKKLEMGESSKMGEEQQNAQWPPGVEHAFTEYLPSELEKMDTVWHKLMAQIEAMFLLNPPYEAPKLVNKESLKPNYDWVQISEELAKNNLKNAELAIQLNQFVEVHNLSSTNWSSEDWLTSAELLLIKIGSYVEVLMYNYKRLTIKPDFVEMDDNMNMNLMIDLVRQGLAKQKLEMSLFERVLSETRAVKSTISVINKWRYEKVLLYTLFFIELQKISHLSTLGLLRILINKPKEVRWPKSVEEVNKVNEVLIKFERMSNFAEYVSLFYKGRYLYWSKSENLANHFMEAKFVKVANLKATVGQLKQKLNLQNN